LIFDRAITIGKSGFHSSDPKNHWKGLNFLEFMPKNLNLGFRNRVIFIQDLTTGQMSETGNFKSESKATLEFHPNYYFGGFKARFEFVASHQGISKSQRSDFS
jgi:hypothetical protein